MSSINEMGAESLGVRARINEAGWIHSPLFDVFLLIAAPLATLPIFVGIYLRIPILAIGGALGLAFVHYASTISFYFWNENKDYYRSRWLAFFGGPALLAVVYWILIGFEVPYIVQVVLFVWNTWHVSRQNCGILSLYRSRAGVSDQTQKNAANNAILAVSFFLAFWNINTHEEMMGFFGWFSNDLAWIIKIPLGIIAAFYLGRLGVALYRREDHGGSCRRLVPGRQPRVLLSISVHQGFRLCHAGDAAAPLRAVSDAGVVAASAEVRDRRRGGSGSVASEDERQPPYPHSGCLAFAAFIYLLRDFTVSAGHEPYVRDHVPVRCAPSISILTA